MQPPTLFQVRTFNDQNRAIYTTQNIKEGTHLLLAEPIAIAVLSTMRHRFCNYCLEQKSELLKCGGCATLYYCSAACQKKDWTIHKQECKRYGVLTKQKGFKITADFVLLVRTFLIYRSDKVQQGKLSQLLDITDFQRQDKREHFQAMAVTLVQNFELEKNTENYSLLISLANKISVNAFTIQDYLFNHDGIAIGIYYPANYFNHSCSPNAVQIFDGRTLRMIATQSIETDEEIFISYIDELLDLPERNKILRQSYLFDCGCSHCIAEKIVKTAEFDLLCMGCGKGALKKAEKDSAFKCGECAKEFTTEQIEKQKKQIKELKDILANTKLSYEVLMKSFFSLKKMLRFGNPYFSKILQNLYIAALEKANSETQYQKSQKYFSDAYKILKSFVENFKTWYKMAPEQEFHPLLLWKYSELGKLAMHLRKFKKAMEYTEKAVGILKKTKFSNNLLEVKELHQRYEQLVIEYRMHVTAQ